MRLPAPRSQDWVFHVFRFFVKPSPAQAVRAFCRIVSGLFADENQVAAISAAIRLLTSYFFEMAALQPPRNDPGRSVMAAAGDLVCSLAEPPSSAVHAAVQSALS
jgi:hypothetical protein